MHLPYFLPLIDEKQKKMGKVVLVHKHTSISLIFQQLSLKIVHKTVHKPTGHLGLTLEARRLYPRSAEDRASNRGEYTLGRV